LPLPFTLVSSSTLKMEATCSSEMIGFQWTKWRYIPEDNHYNCLQNVKSYTHRLNQNLHSLSFEFSVVTRNNRIDQMCTRHMFSRLNCKLLKISNSIINQSGTYFPILCQDQSLAVSTALLPSDVMPLQESN
jgi:hypothetical protein